MNIPRPNYSRIPSQKEYSSVHIGIGRLQEAAYKDGYLAAYDHIVDALTKAFTSDAYYEGANEAAQEGELSWFKWFALNAIERDRES